jgi:hypothetical protein
VFTREEKDKIPSLPGTPFPGMEDILVTEEGVAKLLRNLNPWKAGGPDQMPTRVLKEMSREIAPYLTCIYNASLNKGQVPTCWKSANVTAIYKTGERHKASNYRPVSLTSICCKIEEHILVSSMLKHLARYDCQHGFRARRSCKTQMLTIIHELAAGIDGGKQFDLAMLDFSKAFDRAPHQRLLRKIEHYGMRWMTYAWIADFLHDRKQQVVVDGATTTTVPVISGVPQ